MKFNKFLKLKSSSGQVAIILVLVIAISLILYAVTLNLGKISQIKTLTTVAADQTASLLASQMASYGQQVFEVQLGGKRKICGYTGMFASLLVIVVVVIAVLCEGACGPLLTISTASATFIIAVAVANIVLQLTVVQPGITDMWNDIKAETLTISETFLENGVGTALLGVVTDKKKVTDWEDLDRDGLFGVDSNGKPKDTISRYAVYYTERLKSATKSPADTAITHFVSALKELLYEGSSGWGLFDPTKTCSGSECAACCLPEFQTDINGNQVLDDNGLPIPLRPTDIGCPADPINEMNCNTTSRYSIGSNSGVSTDYPWLFNNNNENENNNFYSFRELLGGDDEHKEYLKKIKTPNAYQQVLAGFNPLPITLFNRFVVQDTEGFYPKDKRDSIIPFFYKVSDWKVDLNDVVALPLSTTDPKWQGCHWCENDGFNLDCGGSFLPQPPEIPQLDLLGFTAAATINTTTCVDGTDNNQGGLPPLAVDKVTFPSNILAADNDCSQDAFSTGVGFWKKGNDRFCARQLGGVPLYPYAARCDKFKDFSGNWCDAGTRNCTCSESGNKSLWPDDVLDDWYNGIPDFRSDMLNILNRGPVDLKDNFASWYPFIASYIEKINPPASNPGGGYVAGDELCYKCDGNQGSMWEALNSLEGMINRLSVFRDTSYAGTSCEAMSLGDPTAVWCVPPPGCANVRAGEVATFDSNGNNIWGDLEDVVACLDWNIDDTVEFTDKSVVTGNYEKFNKCATDCSVEHCKDLPRCLTGFDTDVPTAGTSGELQACLNSCSNTTCQAMPYLTEFSTAGLPNPATVDFDASQCPTWGAGNAWYDAIQSLLSNLDSNLCNATWISNITDCATEARVQMVKFRKRRDFLAGRLAELYKMIVPYDGPTQSNPSSDFTDLEDCFRSCSDTHCQVMNPVYFMTAQESIFKTCLDYCSNSSCQKMPNLTEFTSAGLPNPASVNFDTTSAGECATWGPGNTWYDTLKSLNPKYFYNIRPQILQTCLDNCSNLCQTMPYLPAFASAGLPNPSGVDFDTTSAGECATWGAGNQWYDAILDYLVNTASGNPASMDFDTGICTTWGKGNPWYDKIVKTGILTREAVKFDEFLTCEDGKYSSPDLHPDGPACDLILSRIKLGTTHQKSGLPYHAIYGWQSDPPPGRLEGYWHIVRVDARTPGVGKCDNACNSAGTPTGDPEWPRVKSYTKDWGLKRCYKLVNTDGMVKARVTRYDEERDASSITFPNGIPIWNYRMFHPERGGNSVTTAYLKVNCLNATIPDPGSCPFCTYSNYGGAFMMNEYINVLDPLGRPMNVVCWNQSNALLTKGVSSEACAVYYFAGNGMGIQFVRCPRF